MTHIYLPLDFAGDVGLKEYRRWRAAAFDDRIAEVALGGMGAAANIVAAMIDDSIQLRGQLVPPPNPDRIAELLAANSAEVERRRAAEAILQMAERAAVVRELAEGIEWRLPPEDQQALGIAIRAYLGQPWPTPCPAPPHAG
jgi:hypothetical protein